ncbi:MAG: hypothetical protein AABZ34_14880 [Nitrospirota bacterium]
MSVSSDRTELERQKRRQKIEQHLKEGTAKAETKAASQATRKAKPKAEPQTDLAASAVPATTTTTTEERLSVPVHDPAAPNGLRYRPMKAWERREGNRVVQFRPLTRRELEAEQDAKFFAAVTKDDEAHKEKRKKADEESKRWAKEDRQRREHEEQTGMRPWEPGRYISVEDAGKRGYLGS